MKKLFVLIGVALLILSGCTVVNVSPVSSEVSLNDICIENNPNVTVEDFNAAIQDGFARHGIATRVVSRPAPDNCFFLLSYTAMESWDMVSYMDYATLRLESKGTLLGTADYRLRGGGGLSLLKYQSTKTKLDPIIDELLSKWSK